MSGTTIAYGDRPIAQIQQGSAFATPEFLQFLERLTGSNAAAHSGISSNAQGVTDNAAAIADLQAQLATFGPGSTTALDTANHALSVANAAASRIPTQTTLDSTSAISIPTTTVTAVISVPSVPGNNYIIMATAYLTGSAIVNRAKMSVGINSGVVETFPGSFATLVTASNPSTLGSDLSLGPVIELLAVPDGSVVYLNVEIDTPGPISGYGNLILWPTT